jgi:hypothetical protein
LEEKEVEETRGKGRGVGTRDTSKLNEEKLKLK